MKFSLFTVRNKRPVPAALSLSAPSPQSSCKKEAVVAGAPRDTSRGAHAAFAPAPLDRVDTNTSPPASPDPSARQGSAPETPRLASRPSTQALSAIGQGLSGETKSLTQKEVDFLCLHGFHAQDSRRRTSGASSGLAAELSHHASSPERGELRKKVNAMQRALQAFNQEVAGEAPNGAAALRELGHAWQQMLGKICDAWPDFPLGPEDTRMLEDDFGTIVTLWSALLRASLMRLCQNDAFLREQHIQMVEGSDKRPPDIVLAAGGDHPLSLLPVELLHPLQSQRADLPGLARPMHEAFDCAAEALTRLYLSNIKLALRVTPREVAGVEKIITWLKAQPT